MSTNELLSTIRTWRRNGYKKAIIKLSKKSEIKIDNSTKTLFVTVVNSYDTLEKALNNELYECTVYPNKAKLEFLIL